MNNQINKTITIGKGRTRQRSILKKPKQRRALRRINSLVNRAEFLGAEKGVVLKNIAFNRLKSGASNSVTRSIREMLIVFSKAPDAQDGLMKFNQYKEKMG